MESTEHLSQLNPNPPSSCIFSFSFSLNGLSSVRLTGSLPRNMSRADFFFAFKWEGCTVHLRRNSMLLVSELFKFLQCFCIAVFVAFRMQALGIFTVGPRLSAFYG